MHMMLAVEIGWDGTPWYFCDFVEPAVQAALAATYRITAFEGFCAACEEYNVDLRAAWAQD